MKKYVRNLGVLALIALSFFGCPQSATEKTPEPVKWDGKLNILGYGDVAEKDGKSFVRIVEAFKVANPNIEVVYEIFSGEPYHQKVTARLASGDVPDVAFMGSDARWGSAWKEAGQQVDMTDYINTAKYDLSLFGGADNVAGDYFYVPDGSPGAITVMFANVTLLTSLGLTLPTTYADMKAMVSKATEEGIEVFGTQGKNSWALGSCVFSNFIAQTSGIADWPEKAAAGEEKFTDPEFIAALEFLKTMVTDGVLSKDSVHVDQSTMISKFNDGKYLFVMSGNWDTGRFSEELQKTMKLIPFPAIPDAKGQANTVAGVKSTGYGITKTSVDRGGADLAMKFIDFFNSEAEVTQRLREGSIVAPVLKDYTMPSDLPSYVARRAELVAMVQGHTQTIDMFIGGATNDTLNDGLQEIVAGTKRPQALASEVQVAFDAK